MRQLEAFCELAAELAPAHPGLDGILVLGSCLGTRNPTVCRFEPTNHFHRAEPAALYRALRANTLRRRPSPDLDVWLLVAGSARCPSLASIDARQAEFLRGLTRRRRLSAAAVGRAKRELFGPVYKRPEHYGGFLRGESEPWLGGCFAAALGRRVKRLLPALPPLEIRAFPAPVFHVRPHDLRHGGYRDRLPMAFDLSDWLDVAAGCRVVWQNERTNLWPFRRWCQPQGSALWTRGSTRVPTPGLDPRPVRDLEQR